MPLDIIFEESHSGHLGRSIKSGLPTLVTPIGKRL
jgi:hypothetical protein